jgi:hypothetical protein
VSEVLDKTTARVQLPRVNIEITHSSAPEHNSERLSITIEAVPSFAAFGRYFEAADPFTYWSAAVRLAWLPWLGVARAAMLPGRIDATPRGSEGAKT